jgi:hypothetical protein
MATNVETVTCTFNGTDLLLAPHCQRDNLPNHIKGITTWYPEEVNGPGYYIPRKFSLSGANKPIEFLNNQWYRLFKPENSPNLYTSAKNAIEIGTLGLSYWDTSEHQHPQHPLHGTILATTILPVQTATMSGSQITQSATVPPTRSNQTNPPVIPPTTTVPITIAATHMSASATTGGGGGSGGTGGTVTNPPHSNRGMCGVPPSIFKGTHSNADEFWAQFRHYKLVNRMHNSMTKPFDQVLMALTYIRGPMINDWVNSQEEHLAKRTDITKRGWVHKTNKVLWQEFEAAFQAAWTDTSKKQNAYDQLMNLMMQGWDINTYIAMFD